ncbi:hypothetical protein HOY82DRAFT_265672 [Tuber indicum]|nr:hypothetical protein HOY82DRAFT_265672 [Tuber indicum]
MVQSIRDRTPSHLLPSVFSRTSRAPPKKSAIAQQQSERTRFTFVRKDGRRNREGTCVKHDKSLLILLRIITHISMPPSISPFLYALS